MIDAKLESLRRCLQRLRDRRTENVQALAGDPDRQDIIALNLVRAVQISTDIAAHIVANNGWPVPSKMGEGFALLTEQGVLPESVARSMRAAGGFRNIAVHSYERIDWAVVQSILDHHLADFDAFARAVSAAADG